MGIFVIIGIYTIMLKLTGCLTIEWMQATWPFFSVVFIVLIMAEYAQYRKGFNLTPNKE